MVILYIQYTENNNLRHNMRTLQEDNKWYSIALHTNLLAKSLAMATLLLSLSKSDLMASPSFVSSLGLPSSWLTSPMMLGMIFLTSFTKTKFPCLFKKINISQLMQSPSSMLQVLSGMKPSMSYGTMKSGGSSNICITVNAVALLFPSV